MNAKLMAQRLYLHLLSARAPQHIVDAARESWYHLLADDDTIAAWHWHAHPIPMSHWERSLRVTEELPQ